MGKVATEETLLKTNRLLSLIAGKYDTFSPAEFKRMVKSGSARVLYDVGDQLMIPLTRNGSTTEVPWDIVHIASNGDVYLRMRYPIASAPFDAPEAIFSVGSSSELPAGTYHIRIENLPNSSFGHGWRNGQSIQFTLSKAIPADGQIFIECRGSLNYNPTSGMAVRTYGTRGGTTVLETTTTSNGTSGVFLGYIQPYRVSYNTSYGAVNSIMATVFGNCNYRYSTIRQWLNSSGTEYYSNPNHTGNWWTPKTRWDRPPETWVNSSGGRPGFLNMLPSDFLDILTSRGVSTRVPIDTGSISTVTDYDLVFLPSLIEMNITPDGTGEGETWDYYRILAQEAGITGQFQTGLSYTVLKNPNYVYLRSMRVARSANDTQAYSPYLIYQNGTISSYPDAIAYQAYWNCNPVVMVSGS